MSSANRRSPGEGVGGGELVESDCGVEGGEVHRVTLVTHYDHVPGGAGVLPKLC